MSLESTMAGAVEAVVLSQMEGHAFIMDVARHAVLEGKMGARESLSHRIINESGAGQVRAFLPAGIGGTPTTGLAGPK